MRSLSQCDKNQETALTNSLRSHRQVNSVNEGLGYFSLGITFLIKSKFPWQSKLSRELKCTEKTSSIMPKISKLGCIVILLSHTPKPLCFKILEPGVGLHSIEINYNYAVVADFNK